MSERRCGSCQHWAPPTNPQWSSSAMGGFGQCHKIPHADDPGALDDLVLASDSEGYHAWVETRPEFGCLLWEAKP